MTVTHGVLRVLIPPFRAQNPLLPFSVHYNSMCPLSAHNLHLGYESDISTFFQRQKKIIINQEEKENIKRLKCSGKTLSSSSVASAVTLTDTDTQKPIHGGVGGSEDNRYLMH